jgi:hypothetical protein
MIGVTDTIVGVGAVVALAVGRTVGVGIGVDTIDWVGVGFADGVAFSAICEPDARIVKELAAVFVPPFRSVACNFIVYVPCVSDTAGL